ncbi:MAG: SIS domain-containing protein [Deltaproteobacteria bacterium]|nr:SIS domain-containing protein [Candidatus Anaeroferrophillacea bacterium]
MLEQRLTEHIACLRRLVAGAEKITAAAIMVTAVLRRGGTIFVAGNGGSAADAQHFAAEIVGRFQRERPAWRALALTTDTSILTAVANDYAFDEIFARQLAGLARSGDVLVVISTSGNSANLLRAAAVARERGLAIVGLLGRDGGRLAAAVDCAVVVDHEVTARIQEAHIFILHYWAEYLENELAAAGAAF